MFIPRFTIVHEKTAAVIERFGRFNRISQAGIEIIKPFERVAGKVSLRIQEMQVNVETKTVDDVFVKVIIAVQYFVMQDRVREAFYELSNPTMQIESFVYDEVRSAVPNMKLDDVFRNKDEIANAVKTGLEETMSKYGYSIVKALVNDIDPDAGVKKAMNEINAAQRIRRASEERGEAEKILKIKQAEAEAESMKLRGQGIADQRRAIIDGLRQSVEDFTRSVPGASAEDVMQIVIMTQYFDTMKEIGASARSNTILMPHSPGAVNDFAKQIRDSMITANVTTDVVNNPPPAPREERNSLDAPSETSSTEKAPAERPDQSPIQRNDPDESEWPITRPPGS